MILLIGDTQSGQNQREKEEQLPGAGELGGWGVTI